MKKLILASVFVLGTAFAVSAQNSTETKSCHSDKGTTKSCCQSGSNSTSTGTTSTSTTTTKSCCSKGGDHHSSNTNTNTGTSAASVIGVNKTSTEATTNEEPKK
jgi:hypothetical protein